MRIALIDCDQKFTKSFSVCFKNCLERVGLKDAVIDIYEDPDSFIQKPYRAGEYFMILMDLYQPKTDGIAVSKKIREYDEEIPIVFISSINDFATETYLVNAAYLLMKPVDEKKCFRILNRVLHKMCPQSWKLQLTDDFSCLIKDISYIQVEEEKITLKLHNGESYLIDLLREDTMEKMMGVFRCFYPVTDDAVVNLAHITSFTDGKIELSERYIIPMTMHQTEELRNHISNVQVEIEMNEFNRI